MKKFSIIDLGALVIWILPAAYLFFTYALLPAAVPIHYDLHGKVNGYCTKPEFVLFVGFMMLVSAIVYPLLKFLPLIDPKKQVKFGLATFQKLALGLVIFLTTISLIIIFAAIHEGFAISKILLPAISLLLAFIGNLMNSIKPNYFAGIRTPWTLESDENWRVTHRLASKIWFAGGIILTVLTIILPQEIASVVFLVAVLAMALIPVVYSYVYFKLHSSNQN